MSFYVCACVPLASWQPERCSSWERKLKGRPNCHSLTLYSISIFPESRPLCGDECRRLNRRFMAGLGACDEVRLAPAGALHKATNRTYPAPRWPSRVRVGEAEPVGASTGTFTSQLFDDLELGEGRSSYASKNLVSRYRLGCKRGPLPACGDPIDNCQSSRCSD